MERGWAKERTHRDHQNPSFSSTLLDAICRSIDESDAGGAPDPSATPSRPALASHSAAERTTAAAIPPGGLTPVSTPRSSYNSFYGGFSSSNSEPRSAASHLTDRGTPEAGSVAPTCPPPPSQQVRPLPPPPPAYPQEKSNSSLTHSKLRDQGRTKNPASPVARLASFLNTLLAKGNRKKPKTSTPAACGGDDTTCSGASPYSGWCLTRTPSRRAEAVAVADEGVKRPARFHPCSQQSVCEGDGGAAAEGKERKTAEEVLRGLEEVIDTSSYLFELKSLTVTVSRAHLGSTRANPRGFVS